MSRIVFDRKELTNTLKVAIDFTSKTMSILSHAYIETGKDGCKIATTDLETTFIKNIPYQGDQVKCCIPVSIVLREIKALPDDILQVDMSFKDNIVQVNDRANILTLSQEDFPRLPDLDGEDISIPSLLKHLKKVLPAAGESYTRYTLNSVMFNLQKGHIVATDGHRLHLSNVSKLEGRHFIISRKVVKLAVKHEVADQIRICKDKVIFQVAGGYMITRPVEGDYPSYEQIILKSNPLKVSFSGRSFLKILEGAMPLMPATKFVKLSINGRLEVSTHNSDVGQYHWHINCETSGTRNKDVHIGFDATYLIDAVRSYTNNENDKVILEIKDPLSPCLINKNALVMPMKLS